MTIVNLNKFVIVIEKYHRKKIKRKDCDIKTMEKHYGILSYKCILNPKYFSVTYKLKLHFISFIFLKIYNFYISYLEQECGKV